MSSVTTEQPKDTRGLAGQAIGDTAICSVGQKHLIYHGYEIADLAAHATFEEVAHLLLHGYRAEVKELHEFKDELKSMRKIPEGLKVLLREVAAPRADGTEANPMATRSSSLPTSAGWHGFRYLARPGSAIAVPRTACVRSSTPAT